MYEQRMLVGGRYHKKWQNVGGREVLLMREPSDPIVMKLTKEPQPLKPMSETVLEYRRRRFKFRENDAGWSTVFCLKGMTAEQVFEALGFELWNGQPTDG